MCPRLVKSLIGRRGHLISFALGLVLLASSARVANALVVPQGDSLVSLNMPRFEVDGDVIANASCFPGDTRVCSTCPAPGTCSTSTGVCVGGPLDSNPCGSSTCSGGETCTPNLDWAVIDPAVGTGVVQATRNADGTCTQTGTFAVGTTNVPGTGLLVCDGSKGNFNDTNSFTQGGKEESPVTTCAFGSLDSGIPCKRSTDCANLNPLCTSSGNPFPCCAGNGTGTCTNGTCGINSTTAWIIANGGSPKKGDLAEVYLYAKVGESALDDKVCSSSSGSNAGKFCQTDSDCGTGTCAANPKDQQKDDLFLFADLTRLDVNGDMHADFEFNQRTQGSCGDTDGTTFCQTRLDGDIILSFDLAMGGASPTINIFQFKKTLASGQTCANAPQVSPPCYVLLPPPATPPGTPLATFGALNSQVIPAPPWDSVGCESVDVCSNNPNVTCTSDRNCSGGGFCGPTGCGLRSRIPSFGNMEGFVDLRSFIPNLSLCPGFAQVQVKTRSSPSLNASLLDTTSAIKINLSVCGSIIVKKVGADGVTLLPDAGFTFNPNPSDPTAGPIEVRDGDTADHACSTVGGSVVCDDGTVCLDNVLFSSQGITYSITETTVPPGFVQPTCTKDSDCAGFCGTQTTCSCDTTSGRCAGRVTVSQASTCADRLQRNEADFTFTNLRPDASIQISPPAATNEVGTPHTLTGHVNVSSGSGFVNAKDGTVIKFVKVSGPGTLSASSCTTSGGTGSCSVTLISSTAGTTVVKATTDVSVIGFLLHRETDGMARNSGPAMKTFVDATIAIGPSATNAVGANHTFTVTVKANDGSGSGPQPVSGVKPTVTLASANGATATNVTDTCASTGTNASGQCTVTFTSNSGGTVTGTASVTLSVGGVSLTRTTNGQSGNSGPAVKTFVAGSLRWLKKDNSGKLLGGATFQVCRTADRFGNTISPAQCQTVVDNNSPDADSGAGVFQLNDLVLGTYMIQETKPPLFYTGDSFIETIQLTLTSPNGTATHVWVNAPFGPCVIGYPTGKAPALSSVPFNESEVLRTFGVVTSGGKVVGPATGANIAVPATLNDKVALWYNDEHALTLGVRQVVVNGGTSPGTTNYPFSNFSAYSSALHAASPMVGSTIMSGAQAGTDLALYNTTYGFLIDRQPWNGRPMWPAVFITDITNNPNDKSGDWQQGGTSGVPPSDVFGTWKGAVRTVDETKTPAAITVATDGDPAKNDTLGNARIDGGDIPPGPNGKGFSDSYPTPAGNKTFNEGYTAEARWDLSALGLQAGHAYRLQFMDHDGDQNKTGGDSGENCVNVLVSP